MLTWFSNVKIASKLAIAFGVCLFLAIVAGVVAVSRMAQLNGNTNELVAGPLSRATDLGKIVSDMKQYRIYQLKQVLTQSKEELTKNEQQMTERSNLMQSDMDGYKKAIKVDEDKANFEKLTVAWAAYRSLDGKTDAVVATHNLKTIEAFVNGESYNAFSAADDVAKGMMKWNEDRGHTFAANAAASYESARALVVGLLIIAIVIAVLFAGFVTRGITFSITEVMSRLKSLDEICINNLQTSVQAMAAGDLTVAVPTATTMLKADTSDEFGMLARSVNGIIGKTQGTVQAYQKAQASLSTLIGQTRTSAESITATSDEIATGNEDLSHRTSEQASSLEETAASMEEMTSIVKQSAESARDASKQAVQARDVANDGGAIVAQAVESMAGINAASRQISDIISVIDEIAFQTNLLALNAAVEAARVGEQGRGFAVVASEVRNLAGRSSTAAKEIKSLVQDTVRKVEDGTVLVNRSGEQLKQIVGAVNSVADIVANISAAAQEQSAGIEQVNKAVIQMDEITQQNAALVEEATAASQSMAGQAQELQQLVRRFKIDESLVTQTSHASIAHIKPVSVRAATSNGNGHNRVVGGVGGGRKVPALKLLAHSGEDHTMEEF
ncbi:MAG TPA: methyl-accepting chemotaxis protein [Capsulimonadaceae bacterium]|jgi:methyl-accepting chemotaxis protein